ILHAPKGGPAKYTLVYVRADESIWSSMPENNDENRQKPVKATRREAPLPPELAKRVLSLWEKMLRGVRYPEPENDNDGLDGETIEFWGNFMFGETWSPSHGAPKLFVELGRSLMEYCEAPETKRADLLKVVEGKCQALEE